ncbi:hypothetical protein ACWKWU_12730 [Chitinophaga lutea]
MSFITYYFFTIVFCLWLYRLGVYFFGNDTKSKSQSARPYRRR